MVNKKSLTADTYRCRYSQPVIRGRKVRSNSSTLDVRISTLDIDSHACSLLSNQHRLGSRALGSTSNLRRIFELLPKSTKTSQVLFVTENRDGIDILPGRHATPPPPESRYITSLVESSRGEWMNSLSSFLDSCPHNRCRTFSKP